MAFNFSYKLHILSLFSARKILCSVSVLQIKRFARKNGWKISWKSILFIGVHFNGLFSLKAHVCHGNYCPVNSNASENNHVSLICNNVCVICSKPELARLRLQAGCVLLKLAEEPIFADLIQKEQFQALALLINVSVVKLISLAWWFQRKIPKLLSLPLL